MSAADSSKPEGRRPRIARAISWSAVDVAARAGLGFVVLVILARLLEPTDFGLMAMIAIFVSLSGLLVDSGFNHALIQRQDTTTTDESTIFFFTLAAGLAIALALSAAAPAIAAFYQQPLLVPVTRWMSLALVVNAFGSIHTTLLTKELDFRTIARTSLVASVVSGIVAIAMAALGFGVWALVAQTLVMAFTSTVMLWLLHAWRPRLAFSAASLRSLFAFGGYLLLTGLIYTVRRNVYALLIGRLYPVADVGYYSQAQRLQELPVILLNNIVGRVAFPVFSSAAGDRDDIVAGMRRALITQMLLIAPLMLSLVVLAEPLMVALLGEKWQPSAPILQILAVIGLIWPLTVLNATVMKSLGHSRLHAQIQLASFVVALLLLLVSSPYGLRVIAGGQVLAAFVSFLALGYFVGRLLDYGVLDQLKDLAPYLAASVPAALACAGTLALLDTGPLLELLAAIFAGTLVYGIVCAVARLRALDSLAAFVHSHDLPGRTPSRETSGSADGKES